ncbi:MAG: CHASE2 domain-containing protein [Cyanobacteria bacterium J06554_3]
MSILFVAAAVGIFEPLELAVLDKFFRLRASSQPAMDERLLIVTIDEIDIETVQQWPLSDAMLADLIRDVAVHEPAVIGLDLYRNFHVEPGRDELADMFASTPNLLGVEKVKGESVLPHPTLSELSQTAAADLTVDSDGRVRRGLLSLRSESDEIKVGLSTALALEYLADYDVVPEALDEEGRLLRFGETTVRRFEKNDGGYVNAEPSGFQVVLNYRADYRQFDSISLTSVLNGGLTEERVRDRIVLIGSTAHNLSDLFYTPFHNYPQVPGVYIHAHLTSQLVKGALEGQPFLRTVPDYIEWLWAMAWVAITLMLSRSILYVKTLEADLPVWHWLARLIGINVGLGGASYGLFLAGWWLPMAFPMTAVTCTVALGIAYRTIQMQHLATVDGVTKIANRRYFDQYLDSALGKNQRISLVLCQVDYFKAFNELYGDAMAAQCLQQIAEALTSAVRQEDLVARYSGEAFAVVLSDVAEETACAIAQRLCLQIQQLEIAHSGSAVGKWVTLSCGLAAASQEQPVVSPQVLPQLLIDQADAALSKAKRSGRNCVAVSQWATGEEADVMSTVDESMQDIEDEKAA